jgi:hypothetical protein
MKRAPQSPAKDLPSQLFASNPAMLIGAAFELGMLLGRRSGRTAAGRKVRETVNDAVEQVVQLAPDAMVKLVPQLAAAKPKPKPTPRPRKRTTKK